MNLTKIKSALLERGSSPRIRLISGKTIHLDGPRIIAIDSSTYSVVNRISVDLHIANCDIKRQS
jgi:hypothetical protein